MQIAGPFLFFPLLPFLVSPFSFVSIREKTRSRRGLRDGSTPRVRPPPPSFFSLPFPELLSFASSSVFDIQNRRSFNDEKNRSGGTSGFDVAGTPLSFLSPFSFFSFFLGNPLSLCNRRPSRVIVELVVADIVEAPFFFPPPLLSLCCVASAPTYGQR